MCLNSGEGIKLPDNFLQCPGRTFKKMREERESAREKNRRGKVGGAGENFSLAEKSGKIELLPLENAQLVQTLFLDAINLRARINIFGRAKR